MTFRYLKNLVFEKFFKKLQHYLRCSYFWRVLLVTTTPTLYGYLTLFPHIHLPPIQENWHDHKTFWRFHQIPPIVQGGGIMPVNSLQFLSQMSKRIKTNTIQLAKYCFCYSNWVTDKVKYIPSIYFLPQCSQTIKNNVL